MKTRPDDAGPNEPVPMPSELVDAVLGLLEAAGCPVAVNDQIVSLIGQWERTQP